MLERMPDFRSGSHLRVTGSAVVNRPLRSDSMARTNKSFRALLKNFADALLMWGARRSEVGCVDGIHLADMDKRDSFRQTIGQALDLIRRHDPRRYRRVLRHIHWIISAKTPNRAMEYHEGINACILEFFEMPDLDQNLLAAFWACGFIHEATHGVIDSHQIACTTENRSRIERLCMTELNRFASRLVKSDPQAFPAEILKFEFDENMWKQEWAGKRLRESLSLLGRTILDRHSEPCDSPSGSPPMPPRSPGEGGGPHR